jgi:predicted HNH restriction endonuclease
MKAYRCEDCGWQPTNNYQKRFIHTHHQNGDKTNNKEENLKVLCIECHSNVDGYHTQIKSQPNYGEFIELKLSLI